MKWSWKVGEIGGVGIYIHATFFLLIAWIGYIHWNASRNLASTLEGIGFILVLFLCVLLHELGHSFAARVYRIKTRDITLYPIGGVAQLERMPEKPIQEFVVALAGPAVNVAIAILLYIHLSIANGFPSLDEIGLEETSFAFRVLVANVFLVVFNLLPAFPMDGGRALRALLASVLGYSRATQIAATVGQGMALVFGFVGLLFNPILIFIALFVWIGAGQEATATMMKDSLAGIPVAQAMLTDFRTLAPDDTLGRASDLIIAGSQIDFPVIDNGLLVGLLTRTDLMDGLSNRGRDSKVAETMRTDFVTVHPHDMLDRALLRHRECGCYTVPVTDGQRLLGLMTTENIGEFLMIQAALQGRMKRC